MKLPLYRTTGILFIGLSLLGFSCSVPQAVQDTKRSAATDSVQEVAAKIEALDLSRQGLTKLPGYVTNRTELRELDVSHNSLDGALPAEIRHLANLRRLDLSYNQFTGLPAELGQLKLLEELDVSHNKLTGLPYELGNLTNLKRLVLTGNSYSVQDLDVILKTLPNTEVTR